MTDLGSRRALTVLGMLLLVVPPVAWWSMRGVPDVGAVPGAVETLPSLSAGPSSTEVAQPRAPVRLRAPSIGVDAGIVPVGVAPGGAMEIPTDVDEVGWYRFGPTPGDPGTAVLAGHVDSRTQGRGAFFELQRLDVGDHVVVGVEGSESTWEVVARRQYGKDVIPLDEVFTRGGPPRLVLITCGGEFDGGAGRYLDNVVVYAVPLR